MPATRLKIAEQADPVWQAKVHLAAALRLAVRDELDEGIDNHFTMMVPGYTDRFMILPFGMHWSEARASDIAIFNEQGEVLEGTGRIERSALCIHAPVHRITGARVVLHTHQTWALALNMLKDNRLLPASQTAAFFCGTTAYDDTYTGLADAMNEGERLSHMIGDKQVLFTRVPRASARDEHRKGNRRAVRRRRARRQPSRTGKQPFARRARRSLFRSHDARARSRIARVRRLGVQNR